MKSKKEKVKIGTTIKQGVKPYFELVAYLSKCFAYQLYNKHIRKDRYGVMYSTNNSPFRFDGPNGPTEIFMEWYHGEYKPLEKALAECERFEKETINTNGRAVLYDIFKKEVYKSHRKLFESYEPEYKSK